MELVCRQFANISGFNCNFDLIKRVKDTKPQYRLNRQQRLENLSKAFKVNNENCLEWREPENALKRSQDLEPMYHDVGMFYFMKGNFFMHPAKKTAFIEMDERNIQDIDTVEDWKMAELKYRIINDV